MSFRGLLFCSLFSNSLALAQSPFEKAARDREVARQRAFDRGQKTALPAAERREEIGRLPAVPANVVRASDGQAINQGAPSAAVYNRVMETRRHFRDKQDPFLWNANDTFTDSTTLAERVRQETQTIYPDLAKSNSAFAMRFAVINRWVDLRQPPLAKDSRRMLLVAHMVSLELTGNMARDSLGLAQVPMSEQIDGKASSMLEKPAFEIEVIGNTAYLPDGFKGKVKRGGLGSPDCIEWVDAAGEQRLLLPQQTEGRVSILANDERAYERILLPNGNFRVRFFTVKP